MSLKGRAVAAWNAAIFGAILLGSLRTVLYFHRHDDEINEIAQCDECGIGGSWLCPSHEELVDNFPTPRGIWLARYLRLD